MSEMFLDPESPCIVDLGIHKRDARAVHTETEPRSSVGIVSFDNDPTDDARADLRNTFSPKKISIVGSPVLPQFHPEPGRSAIEMMCDNIKGNCSKYKKRGIGSE